jgi:putative tryptophan/tyrosine transport system permease protein
VEGSFGMGAAITALCLKQGLGLPLSFILALSAGGLCGLVTALLHTKLKLNSLISGVITTTGLFSIMLVLAGSNIMIPAHVFTIFSYSPAWLMPIKAMIILVPLVCGIIVMGSWFLRTEIGFLLRALGNNRSILTILGKNTVFFTALCLIISNMITALSGCLLVQYTGYFSIWAQVGMLIVAFVGLILSEMITNHFGFALVFGAIMYQAIIAFVFELQIDPAWNKLITAMLMIGLLIVQKQQLNTRNR